MKLFKQPWFLILLLIVSIYTYQYYSSPSSFSVSVNEAEAVSTTNSDSKTAEEKTDTIKVNITQEFPAKTAKNFYLATYQDVEVNFVESDSEKIKVQLEGSGNLYKNNGTALSDWFTVKSKSSKLSIKSFNSKNKREDNSL